LQILPTRICFALIADSEFSDIFTQRRGEIRGKSEMLTLVYQIMTLLVAWLLGIG